MIGSMDDELRLAAFRQVGEARVREAGTDAAAGKLIQAIDSDLIQADEVGAYLAGMYDGTVPEEVVAWADRYFPR